MSTYLLPVRTAPLSAIVATNVRAEAARRGMSQSALARAIGKSQPTVNERWRGKVAWQLDELAAVAEVFGISVTGLLEARDETAPAFVDAGVLELPRLDSNQQPFD